MELRSSTKDAVVKDAQIMPNKEECASSTEQSLNDVVVKDVQIKSSKEECAAGMEGRDYAEAKDVQTKSSVEEYVGGTERIETHTMYLLHLDQNSR